MGYSNLSGEERNNLIKLRKTGNSISEIATKLGRSKSTVSRYVKGVSVLSRYKESWASKRGGSAIRADERRKNTLIMARKFLQIPEKKDSLLIASCLYWGEGNKSEFGFTNSDPLMIKTLILCLTNLGLDKARLKVSIRIYEDINISEAKLYWAKVVGMSKKRIGSVNILSGKKKGKLPNGMCRIRIERGNDYFNLLTITIKLINKKYAPIVQK